MARYIELDPLVAEIERLKKEEGWCQVGKDTADVYYARGFRFACERIINALNTLEAKEVNLEKEIDRYYNIEAPKEFEDVLYEDIEKFAKHFFELGMQVSNNAQKEPVSEDLEKAAIEAFKRIVDTDKNNFLEIFKAGAKWQKEQIMKEAIDAELDDICGFLTISVPYHNGIAGDKVKVIIIKSE